MIRGTAQPFTRLVCWALLLATVVVPLQAQQPAAPFVTGPCSPPDSLAMASLSQVVSNPEVPPMQKSGQGLPDFPAEVQRAGYNGKVVVAFIVTAHGRVDPTSVVVMSSTDSRLSRWACKATPSIRFVPARDHGHAVTTQTMLPFIYHGPPAKDSTPQSHRPAI